MIQHRNIVREAWAQLKTAFLRPYGPEPLPGEPTYDWGSWGIGAWCGLMAAYAAQALTAAELELDFGPAPVAVLPALLAGYLFAKPLQGRGRAPLSTIGALAYRVAVSCGGLSVALLLLAPAPAATGAAAATVTEALITTPLIAAVELTLNALAIAAGIAVTARLRR